MNIDFMRQLLALQKQVDQIKAIDAPAIFAKAAPATTGTMTVVMSATVITITPTGACTFNASGGVAGATCTFVVTTAGTTSYTLTWGTAFKSTGTLSTGTVSGVVFTVSFVYDGVNWSETGRTAAM